MTRIYLKKRLYRLIEQSTCHALPKIVTTESKLLKIVWLVAYIVSASYAIFSIINVIIDYFGYSVLNKIEIIQDFDQDFPAVTFCNINPIDFSKDRSMEYITNYLYRITGVRGNIIQNYDNVSDSFSRQLCRERTSEYFYNIDLSNFSFSLDKMLISCTFDGRTCNSSDFILTKSRIFGNCYSFNTGYNYLGEEMPVLKAKRKGLSNGLDIKLFTGLPEFHPCWAISNGAVVAVHNRSRVPVIIEDGHRLENGVHTSLIIKKVIYKSIGAPYSSCKSSESENSIPYNIYSQRYCITSCATRAVLIENRKKCTSMNFTNEYYLNECLNNYSEATRLYSQCAKSCPIDCESISYDVRSSFIEYPSPNHGQWLLSRSSIRNRFTNKSPTLDDLSKSILAFSVNYGDFDYTAITEIPATNPNTLISSLGGTLGLFLGMSLLSFIEIFEIIFEILRFTFSEKFFNQVKIINF